MFFYFIMASLNYFKRLSKEEKDFVKNYIYDLLMKKSPEEIYNKYKPSEDLFNKCKEVFSPNEYHDLYCIKTEFLDKLDQNPDPKDEEAQIFFFISNLILSKFLLYNFLHYEQIY